MTKCKCYESINRLRFNSGGGYSKVIYSYCNGTKELDVCSCGGDRTKCDFYPNIREEALKEINAAKTNAEVIKDMTDDELAEFLMSDWFVDNVCRNCESYKYHYDCKDPDTCATKVLNWLQSKNNIGEK